MRNADQIGPDRAMRRASLALLEELGTARALTVAILLRDDQKCSWDAIVNLAIDPLHYLDNSFGALKFAKDYQATDLLRKCEGLPTSYDQEREAIEGWLAAENQNKLTNDRFQPLCEGYFGSIHARVVESLVDVQNTVRSCLGPLPKHPNELEFQFGPGSVKESKDWWPRLPTIADKLSNQMHVTASAADLLRWFLNGTAAEASLYGGVADVPRQDCLFVTDGSERFAFANKDAKTKRTISLQPGGNILLQKAFGLQIRQGIRQHFGWDLNRAQPVHRRMAMHASKSNSEVTIDLRNASNTVARNAVRFACKRARGWYDLLDAVRCKSILFPSKYNLGEPRSVDAGEEEVLIRRRLEMFSAMGNGFTFELQTLLFGAICKSVVPASEFHRVRVFGDDIIVPTEYSSVVLAALKFWGFTPNQRKTHTTGVFRESCGGDYFDGFFVSPVRVKELPHDPATWIGFANRCGRVSYRQRGLLDSRPRRIALAQLPAPHRTCIGPDVLGDTVIWSRQEDWERTSVTRSSIRYLRVWRPVASARFLDRYDPSTILATALYGAAQIDVVRREVGIKTDGFFAQTPGSSEAPFKVCTHTSKPYITPRGAVSGFRFGRVPYS